MKKILIVRVGRVGDMVMCTPALSALLHHCSDAEFTFLTSHDGKRILENFSPRLNHFWVYDRKFYSSLFLNRKINTNIVNAGFQQIYCFECNKRYYRLFKGSAAAVYGLREIEHGKHYAQLLLDVVSRGVKKNVGHYPLSLPIDDGALKKNDELMGRQGFSSDTLLVGFHPTFSGALKQRKRRKHGQHKLWPARFFAQLADRLQQYARQEKFKLRVVMNLLPEEEKFGEEITAKCQERIDVFLPEPDFKRYLAYLDRLDLFISSDTGPMHLAAAVDTPLIALFSGKNPRDCGPFKPNERYRVLRAEDIESSRSGIAAISVESVFHECQEQIRTILNRKQTLG